MSIINNFLRHQKVFASFLFVFIFLYSGIIRGVLTSGAENYTPNYTQHDSDAKSNISTQHNHFNNLSIVNQYKEKSESETDEAHFDFGFTFTSHSLFTFLPYPNLSRFIELNWINTLKQPLYVLFCNWKFHLI